ncbi:aminotransferase class I/II-fold pyridoxal phosphate-dependent enzyme [Arthrobacter sp. JZ12]|uniref:pyridoxal phosphate-dependent aminotransferase n=1 Tax=Arthrobacter sp. JZ12 TaxID=2654190 RepID=UPI002B476AD8|nr:pyridoxal phosphate-dependent aminotransferase [Arthrobacter sp. JZ12]WRH24608.1 aminotransferase class I/II-fold pyridoxal phosphate-dependent enzyme [Arthrobacter sp. JZ12]
MPSIAQHIERLPSNQIREITQAAWATPGAIVLSIGEPAFPVPRHILQAGIAALDRDETNYTPNEGITPLRSSFAARFAKLNGMDVDPSRVYVTAGAQQGLHLAMSMLLDAGDEVLIPNPGYPTFTMTAQLVHARPVDYPLRPEHGFQPQISDLEELVTDKTRVLVLNSPSNPLGAVFSEDLTRDLVRFARRHDLWILSDECYEAFTFGVPHVSPARFDTTNEHVVTSLTLSKTFGLTGLRIGALILPDGMGRQFNAVMESIVSCVGASPQYAAVAALTGPEHYIATAAHHYRTNRDTATSALKDLNVPFLDAQGAFYLWADMSHATGGDVRSWARRFLAEQKVAVAPGTAFGTNGEGWIRIALCGDRDELISGLSRLPRRSSI